MKNEEIREALATKYADAMELENDGFTQIEWYLAKRGYLDGYTSRDKEVEELVEALRDALGWVESHHDMHEWRKSFAEMWKSEIELGRGYEHE